MDFERSQFGKMQLWIVEHFHLHKKVPVLMNHNTWKNHMLWFTDYGRPVRKSSSLHSPKPTPAPKIFWVRPKHILSATLAQIFRFLWFLPSLGVRSPCYDLLLHVPFSEDESVQLFRVAFCRSDFFQNPYFSRSVNFKENFLLLEEIIFRFLP